MRGIGTAHGPRSAGNDVLLASVRLAPGDVLRIGDGRGLLVEALEGSFWLTQEGEGCDVDVRERGSFRLDRNGCALLTTRRGGVLGVCAPVTQSLATRIDLDCAASADRVVIHAATSRRPGPFVRLVEFCR